MTNALSSDNENLKDFISKTIKSITGDTITDPLTQWSKAQLNKRIQISNILFAEMNRQRTK